MYSKHYVAKRVRLRIMPPAYLHIPKFRDIAAIQEPVFNFLANIVMPMYLSHYEQLVLIVTPPAMVVRIEKIIAIVSAPGSGNYL